MYRSVWGSSSSSLLSTVQSRVYRTHSIVFSTFVRSYKLPRNLPEPQLGPFLSSFSTVSSASSVPSFASNPYIQLDRRYTARTYDPLPVVLKEGKGIYVYDTDNKRYMDYLSGYSALNHGHNHPRILTALHRQASRLSLTSRAFYNDQLGVYAEYITKLFGYDMMVPMNTGVEAGETACKLARKWGYRKKGVPSNQGIILMAKGNFWGRTITAISTSDDPLAYQDYGPFVSGFKKIPYGDPQALENELFGNSNIIAYYVEPIQGEAGIIVPPPGYLQAIAKICQRYGVLLIFDEIQTGLGRTGRLLAGDHENVRPDILVLGKALGGGVYPVSAVLANKPVMEVFEPGTHGSTFGGNPLACAIAQESLQTLLDEKLIDNAEARGIELRHGLMTILTEYPNLIEQVRGKGLLNAIVVRKDAKTKHNHTVSAWDICMAAKDTNELGLLAKPTHEYAIRLAPPLIITSEEIQTSLRILKDAVRRVAHGEYRSTVKH